MDLGCRFEIEIGGRLIAVYQNNTAISDAVADRYSLNQAGRHDDHIVRSGDAAADVDKGVVGPYKGGYRRSASFSPKGRKLLGVTAFKKERMGQNSGGDNGSLAAAAMKTNLLHNENYLF